MLLGVGCQPDEPAQEAAKTSRPVTVQTLRKQAPPEASLVSANVGSWKTERIGFEVGGRVEWVVEPNTQIEGRIKDQEGEILIEGTPVARIDEEPYRLKLASAKARVAQSKQQIAAAEIEFNNTIPAQIVSAEAEKKLAQSNYDRTKGLRERNAVSQSELDRDAANLSVAEAKLAQLQATLNAKKEEVASLKAQLLEAQQTERDAERDLENCTLYASFNGQIAEVAVVPGSVVSVGQEVAMLQMIDPIKVEVEVSAADSRRLRHRQRIPVMVTLPDGGQEVAEGFLYQIDSVADSATRTFTMTILLLNERVTDREVNSQIALTDQLWRLDFKFLPGRKEGQLFVPERGLLKDDNGHWLWKVENVEIGEAFPADRILKVTRLPVKLGDMRIPFLGNWFFQEVIIEDKNFDPDRNFVTSSLRVQTRTPEEWDGDTVFLSSEGQWKFRPGDVVRVDLSSEDLTDGYFVPMETIVREDGQSFLYVVEEEGREPKVRKLEIQVVEAGENNSSSMRRIKPVGNSSLEGLKYVAQGAHYLRDGEAVKVVPAAEVNP